jgi:hypothetical protein
MLKSSTFVVCAEVVTIPQQPPSPLMPAAGLVYRAFPDLILVEHNGDGPGLRLRRTGNSSKKRQNVGKRRAISELMVRTYALIHYNRCCQAVSAMRRVKPNVGWYQKRQQPRLKAEGREGSCARVCFLHNSYAPCVLLLPAGVPG